MPKNIIRLELDAHNNLVRLLRARILSNNHAEIEQLAQITNDLMNRVQALEEAISAFSTLNSG